MKAVDLVNYLLGTVEFDVTGASTEPFLTALMKENLDVWHIEKRDGVTLRMRAKAMTVPALTELAKASRCELKTVSRRGLPFFLRRYRSRYGLMVGAVLFVAVLLFLSSFVWSVDVVGARTEYEAQRVLDALKENGFAVGSPLAGKEYGLLKLQTLTDLDGIAYLTVNVTGTKAVAEITHTVPVPVVTTRFKPCNIIAAEDGVIVSVRAYNGVTCVKKGDAVSKGQLLVGGVYDSKVLGYRVAHASARVMAETSHTESVFIPYDYAETVATGRESGYAFIELFGRRLALTFDTSCPYGHAVTSETSSRAALWETYELPLVTGHVTFREVTSRRVGYDEALSLARAAVAEKAHAALAGLEVVSSEETVNAGEKGLTLRVVYTVIRDIAKEEPIMTEDKK